jgi:hypothetical protein
MLLFRSEEHVHRWIEERRIPIGGTMTTDQGWRLADVWFRDRLNPAWRPRTPAETEEVFTSIGLTGPFWDLRG